MLKSDSLSNNAYEDNHSSLLLHPLSRSLVRDGSSASRGVCIPSTNLLCEFSTTFSIDFGDRQESLKSRKAKAIFEYLGTQWLNDCGSRDESYFGLFFDTTEDEIHGRKLGYSGVASGKCKGYNCPPGVSFSFPSRRLQTGLRNGSRCSGERLVDDLLVYPDFFTDETSKPTGILFVDHEYVHYDVLDACEESFSQCEKPEQRTAAQDFLTEAGLKRFVDSSKHECEWEGFHCDSNRSITGIFLRQKRINGIISRKLGELTDLEDVDLADNTIAGTIPTEIGRLRRLKTLSLNDNLLTGTLPLEMGSLANIKEEFSVGKNSLKGSMSHYCPRDIEADGCPRNVNQEKGDRQELRGRDP